MASTEVLMPTPGGHGVKVRVLNKKYPIRQGARTHAMVARLDDSGIQLTARCIKERIDHKRDCPILVTGDRGAGKSTVISKVAHRIDPDFPIDNVAFRLIEFEQIFNKNPIGDGSKGVYPQVWMDEAGYDMFGPEWLKLEQRMVAKMLIIGRIKQQIIWLTVPKRKQLNYQIREMPYMWIHVAERKEYEQGLAYVRIAPPEFQNEWFSERYWLPRFAFVFTEDKSEWWDRYEEKKIAFVNEVASATADKKSRQRDQQEVNWVKKLRRRGWTQEQIAEFLGKDQSTVSRLLATEI